MADNSNIGLILLFEKKKPREFIFVLPLALKILFCEAFRLLGIFCFRTIIYPRIHSPPEIICVTTEKLFFRMAEWCNNGPLKFDWLAASAGNQLYSREPVRFSGALNPSF